jgi:hypothetical protein
MVLAGNRVLFSGVGVLTLTIVLNILIQDARAGNAIGPKIAFLLFFAVVVPAALFTVIYLLGVVVSHLQRRSGQGAGHRAGR